MDAQLVSTSWLAANLAMPSLVVLDCSWYLPESGKKGVDDFFAGHIPGARYLDLEEVSDPDSAYVNMLPGAARFEERMRALGINRDSLVVVYDAGYVSARIWWMLRAFGHEGVRILDGGWRKWKADGLPVQAGAAYQPAPGDFAAAPQSGKVADWRDALAASRDGAAVLVDARTSERFTGALPSGYPGVPGGHMPNAINTPWSRFMDAAQGHVFVSPEQARDILVGAGVDLTRPIITTCGSGVTAAILALMLERIGQTNYRLYDGSWHEWAQRGDLPRVSVAGTTLARDTLLVSAGRESDLPGRPVNPPIVRASTFLFNSLQELESASKAPFDGPFYGRLGTPTTFAFERAMAEAEGGYRSIATSSGLSAIVAVLVAFLKAGDHVLIVDSVYDPVRRFCNRVLAGMGVEFTFYDPGLGAAELELLIRPATRLIYMESPGSGTFEVQDVPAIVALARRRKLVTAMDNTWATPVYYRPLEHGVDISIHAATKYIVGHSDAVLGVITTNEATWGPVRQASQDLGASAGSEECNLGLRGLRTLAVRMRRHEATAVTLARWLAAQPAVSRVFHPALESSVGHAYWKRDFQGSSGLFSIELGGMLHQAFDAFTSKLKLFSIGFSWGGFESLILPVHPEKSRTASPWQGAGPVLRLHAGLEDPADLQADLEAGFAAARSAAISVSA